MTDRTEDALTDELKGVSAQVASLITENQRLRRKSELDDSTIEMLTNQYEGLSSKVEGLIAVAQQREHILQVDSDKHRLSSQEIEGVLKQVGELIASALAKRVGNSTPPVIPDRQIAVISDSRLPEMKIPTELKRRPRLDRADEAGLEGLEAVVRGIENLNKR